MFENILIKRAKHVLSRSVHSVRTVFGIEDGDHTRGTRSAGSWFSATGDVLDPLTLGKGLNLDVTSWPGIISFTPVRHLSSDSTASAA